MIRIGHPRPEPPVIVRLARLHLASRRIPAGVAALTLTGLTLRIVLRWTPASGLYSVLFPLIVAAGAACVTAVTAGGPFGDTERAAGRLLPYLRLATVLTMISLTCCVLAAGSFGGHLALGLMALLRDTLGLTGVALLTAVAAGANLSWTGPLAYLVLSIYAVGQYWTNPWIWADRPPADPGAAICAATVLAAGLAAIAARGPADTSHDLCRADDPASSDSVSGMAAVPPVRLDTSSPPKILSCGK